ncbi:MAG: succinylglutamate desuccinylase/aspartoacylase family protein [Gammaproteobacteria bacterium]
MNRSLSVVLIAVAMGVMVPVSAERALDAPGISGNPARLTETDAASESVVEEQVELAIDSLTPPASAPLPQPITENATVPDADAIAMPVAPDVDLSEPVVEPAEEPVPAPVVEPEAATPVTPEVPVPIVVSEPPREALVLLGEEVAPGTSSRLSWSPDQHFDGIAVPTPVLVVNGAKNGKTLCLTAAVHGDELNGIEIVRRVLYDLDPEDLSGAVIGVPIVNLQGFRRSSRYLPDRRDLNRFFPGNPDGSSASRIAHSFFRQVVSHCDALVDVHTGSFLRSNLPQLRADMTQPEVAALTKGFGATAVLHSTGTRGTLRRAATDAGIPAVTLETGEPSRLQEKDIQHGTKGILTLLNKLDLVRRVRVWGEPEPVYYQSTWVRAGRGGLLFGNVKLGQRVRKGSLLGTITDPITNVRSELKAPVKGRILGMALNQVVLPGFAAYRIGIPSTDEDVAGSTAAPTPGSNSTSPDDVPMVLPDPDSEEENSE